MAALLMSTVLRYLSLVMTCAVLFACDVASENTQAENTEHTNIPEHSDKAITAYIISPSDGATVSSPLRVIFGLQGMGVAPAGSNIENTGHHHLLIDVDELPDLSMPLPATANLVHFGKGQTETLLELAPGTHTLQLLLGNYAHIPHSTPVLSEKITITVK
ncbi:MAG: DUF4399 domain-containing protein [Gammaproteobacteria bacterium]|nr:DUF4399 domain-containing protein [Gammaproteobacteria bacterium]NNM14031.1 DUF4399 domain-containing protein [Gammaproteobacteria bacterium]